MTLLVAVSYTPLTESFRQRGEDEPLRRAAEAAGERVLWLTLAALVLGAVYAAADRRLELSPRVHRVANVAAVTAVAVGIAAGAALFLARVDSPGDWAGDRWRDFKTMPEREEGSSHLVNLGSNRYDFWRVAWDEFERHPLAGIGAFGWGNAYLIGGESLETPVRAHSVELDALAETGVIGFLLLVGSGATLLFGVARRARSSLLATGALGAASYFAVHTGGDWVWTIPAVGLPVFVIAGIALSEPDAPRLPGRIAIPAGIATVLVAALAFSPPWLSSRFVEQAYDANTTAEARDALRWARRLDPLSIGPYLAETTLVDSPADIPPLRRAVAKEPRNADLRFVLGLALLDAGRKEDARRELRIAVALAPRAEAFQDALERAG
jgi:hypothetical protein